MTNIPMMMRGGAVIAALTATLLVQGCAMPQSSASGSFYSGADQVAALASVMTTDQGGE